jgi:hypothetical protein
MAGRSFSAYRYCTAVSAAVSVVLSTWCLLTGTTCRRGFSGNTAPGVPQGFPLATVRAACLHSAHRDSPLCRWEIVLSESRGTLTAPVRPGSQAATSHTRKQPQEQLPAPLLLLTGMSKVRQSRTRPYHHSKTHQMAVQQLSMRSAHCQPQNSR